MSETSRQLKAAEVAEMLRATGKSIVTKLSTLPTDLARWRPAEGEWCALEVLGHLIESEQRGFAGRIRTLLAADGARLEGWDQEDVAGSRRDHERDPVDLLKQFQALRRDSAALVERLTATDLARAGDHPTIGRVSVGELIHEWIYHDLDHVMQVHRTIQRALWASMGSTQKFYER